jgi:hypothetical protein
MNLTFLLLFTILFLEYLSLLNVIDVFRYFLDAFMETYSEQSLLVV